MCIRIVCALAILVVVEIAFLRSNGVTLADFDFGSGLVRCGVAGLSTSCGSLAP